MIDIDEIKDDLNTDYIVPNTYLEEKKEKMKIEIKYNEKYILFQSDKKGAISLECFNQNQECINRRADYIIITVKNNTIHCVIIELKKNDDPREQLILTEYFAQFMLNRICYKYYKNKKFPNIVFRKIGAFKDKIPGKFKTLTKPSKIYNDKGFAYIDKNTLLLGAYL
ncbi:hypothetical protein EZS27_027936 [termite gut metagenome]|uniref:Uncharacterized protein n=1 Tax=termite gut metagenome TaxID=433724 RepID=A0A5J4QNE0_9ZZZZ